MHVHMMEITFQAFSNLCTLDTLKFHCNTSVSMLTLQKIYVTICTGIRLSTGVCLFSVN